MLDIGGPFYNKKQSVDMGIDEIYHLAHASPPYSRFYGYDGPLVADISTDSAMNAGPFRDDYLSSQEFELDAAGATAISRCAPTVPHVSVFNAVGELYRDGLPAVPGLTTLRDRNVGSEYLNYQFGIAPIVSDIRKLHTAMSNAEKILRQYYRDSGRLVRRSYSFPIEEKVISRVVRENHTPVGGNGSSNSYLWLNTGQLDITVTEKTERWFSGAFTYYAKTPDDVLGKIAHQIQGYNHLLGILPSPEVLWNLTPWSWAADWVTNIGDVMSNLSMYQNDGLVMRYGYIMEHKFRESTYHHNGAQAKVYGGGTQRIMTTQRFNQETKRRRPATPFGFGLELDSLSARQLAIIAALGISRGGGSPR